jgi:adenylosuccinate synthase
MATIVLGSQWGDEGKGKIVDVIASQGIQLCCRAQGGHNAGHTIVKNGTTFDVHILRTYQERRKKDILRISHS